MIRMTSSSIDRQASPNLHPGSRHACKSYVSTAGSSANHAGDEEDCSSTSLKTTALRPEVPVTSRASYGRTEGRPRTKCRGYAEEAKSALQAVSNEIHLLRPISVSCCRCLQEGPLWGMTEGPKKTGRRKGAEAEFVAWKLYEEDKLVDPACTQRGRTLYQDAVRVGTLTLESSAPGVPSGGLPPTNTRSREPRLRRWRISKLRDSVCSQDAMSFGS